MKSKNEADHEPEIKSQESGLDGATNSEKPDSREGVIRKVATSESFVEKVLLLLLTIILSGIIVPIIINYLTSKSAERQKAIEAMKAKDQSILQAQSNLLNDLSETILTYETLALDASWYGTEDINNKEMHQKAFLRYNDRTVDLISKLRALASRAQTLASPAISNKINAFMYKIFEVQDKPLNRLYTSNASFQQWGEQHEKTNEMLVEANSLISEIANDLGLSRDNLHQ
jgi:cell division protein FtsL